MFKTFDQRSINHKIVVIVLSEPFFMGFVRGTLKVKVNKMYPKPIPFNMIAGGLYWPLGCPAGMRSQLLRILLMQ